MTDFNTVIEGTVKFRDGKKWKSRWCVMRKLSPVADCLHLQLYRDSKDRYKQGQTKASLSLQQFLGVESGFTLDKESNTIAIICQDVTVVLAFDTRERLIQWQVKISANLGDDQQFLIQIASCPTKSKISAGPARLHIQDLRFSLTTGVPPKLAGVWELRYLRKYGVIENRFCYEGGSRCGKGEGLFVCFTDQGDEITRCMNLAAESKLASRKRFLTRNMSVLESPSRRGGLLSRLDSRASEYGGDQCSFIQHSHDRNNEDNSCWPSNESRLDNSDFGDTASVGDFPDHSNSQECTWTPEIALERCASCISKLGALSRSSTMANTPGSIGFNPAWTMDNDISTQMTNGHQCCGGYVSSQSSSSGGSGSVCSTEYSVPRKVSSNTVNEKINKCQPETCTSITPSRPPKPIHMKQETNTAVKKAPMPLPSQPENSTCTCRCSSATNKSQLQQPKQYYLNNYDTPKSVALKHNTSYLSTIQDEYYDTPRNIKSVLEVNPYGNYDTPPSPVAVHKKKSAASTAKPQIEDNCNVFVCPCQKSISCWSNNYKAMPLCNNLNHTNNGFRSINYSPDCQGQKTVIYATVDVTKKKKHTDLSDTCTNYMNLEPGKDQSAMTMTTTADRKTAENYMNLEFSESLCHYENAKSVLTKVGMAPVAAMYDNKCSKCGHQTMERDENGSCSSAGSDYMTMEPVNGRMIEVKRNLFPGYLHMSPAAGQRDMLKNVLNKGLAEKSVSIPSLNEYNVGGAPINKTLTRVEEPRRRSSSAGSSTTVDSNRYDDDDEEQQNVSATDQPSSGRTSSADSMTSQIAKCPSGGVSRDDQQAAVLVHIRRSSSVPCKNNRDSSSSNDSGVSTGSLRYRGADFAEFELPLTTSMSTMRHRRNVARDSTLMTGGCVHGSLPRRSKSTDRLKELSFRFQRFAGPMKSSSAGAEVPVCMKKEKGYNLNTEGITAIPFLDSQSTSSCTSDMSDYIETLSLSSHSSSDTNNENLRFGRPATKTTLKPRSGKEYHQIGYFLDGDPKVKSNVPPVPEKSESSSTYLSTQKTNKA
ncbi:uncharacterized protein LOC126896501 isoform X2 [Daktulosphaira vitifoliae]|uniref:uncharacterized protein LOC126896501 isoform X2 n=1 Tax=Daktulosphaira vitifoliae TaxID=58002 RepID=UPI0021AA5C98|nr:uncharacterized protein LOC126896501 isoform X2 [Daktulosphaira vitifoliae]